MQAIAANLDTLFVVTSCNDDFNLSRLERYFTVARHAQVETVIVLTKADLCADTDSFAAQARSIARDIAVLALNATAHTAADALAAVARARPDRCIRRIIGCRQVDARQRAARERSAGDRRDSRARREGPSHDDVAADVRAAVGCMGHRHARHARAQARIVEAAVSEVFDDIEALAKNCRFRDCQHRDDAGCALHAAVAAGHLDARRLSSYQKLQREAERASQSLHETRERAALGPHASHAHFEARPGNSARMTRTASSASFVADLLALDADLDGAAPDLRVLGNVDASSVNVPICPLLRPIGRLTPMPPRAPPEPPPTPTPTVGFGFGRSCVESTLIWQSGLSSRVCRPSPPDVSAPRSARVDR